MTLQQYDKQLYLQRICSVWNEKIVFPTLLSNMDLGLDKIWPSCVYLCIELHSFIHQTNFIIKISFFVNYFFKIMHFLKIMSYSFLMFQTWPKATIHKIPIQFFFCILGTLPDLNFLEDMIFKKKTYQSGGGGLLASGS
jgi:hypothetical protein